MQISVNHVPDNYAVVARYSGSVNMVFSMGLRSYVARRINKFLKNMHRQVLYSKCIMEVWR